MARNRYKAFWRHSVSQPHQGFHLQALNQELEEGLWLLPLQGSDHVILFSKVTMHCSAHIHAAGESVERIPGSIFSCSGPGLTTLRLDANSHCERPTAETAAHSCMVACL